MADEGLRGVAILSGQGPSLFDPREAQLEAAQFQNGSSWLLAVLKWAEVVVIWAQDHQREC